MHWQIYYFFILIINFNLKYRIILSNRHALFIVCVYIHTYIEVNIEDEIRMTV